MPLGAAILGGAALTAYASWRGAKETSKAATQAADIQAKAAEDALAWQKEVYGNIKPYLMSSLSGYQDLLQNPESITQTPGYLFRLNQGLKSIGIPEGSQPKDLSGAQIRGAIQYSQDYATSEYQNALARIAGLGSLAQGVYGAGQSYATAAGNTAMQGAQATAGGITGAAAARSAGWLGVGSAANQGINQYMLYNMYRNFNNPVTTGVGAAGGAGTVVPSTPVSPIMSYGYTPPGGVDYSAGSNYGLGGWAPGPAVDYGSSNY